MPRRSSRRAASRQTSSAPTRPAARRRSRAARRSQYPGQTKLDIPALAQQLQKSTNDVVQGGGLVQGMLNNQKMKNDMKAARAALQKHVMSGGNYAVQRNMSHYYGDLAVYYTKMAKLYNRKN